MDVKIKKSYNKKVKVKTQPMFTRYRDDPYIRKAKKAVESAFQPLKNLWEKVRQS